MTGLGTGYITEEEAAELLDELIELEALEIQILPEKEITEINNGQNAPEMIQTDEKEDFTLFGDFRQQHGSQKRKSLVRMPYMMNDAVEYFLEFQECAVRGEWEEDVDAEDFSFVADGDSHGLILRQVSGNTVTIWYQKIFRKAECYQYHQIGHNWRKKSGEENLRRLVNLLCVMHDKVSYLGGDFCNETERELYQLAEYGPLRYFSPINESILEWYPETEEGAEAMLRLAEKAGDAAFSSLTEKYRNDLRAGKRLEKRIKMLAGELLQISHYGIVQTLEEEIGKASEIWKVREYGLERRARIEAYRQKVEEKYKELGYKGDYPRLYLTEGRKEWIVQFVEEHPFTVLEYDDYEFRIFSMISEKEEPYRIKMQEESGPLAD